MDNRRHFLLAFVVGTLSLGLIAAPAPAAELLRGQIKEVDADRQTLSVIPVGENDDHPGVLVRVNAETVITDEDGKRLALDDIQRNNGVAVEHENSLASKIVVNTGDDDPNR